MNRLILLLAAVVLLAVPALTDNRQEAVSKLEQDVKSSPNNPELWLHLGFAYRKADQIDQAQSAFQKRRRAIRIGLPRRPTTTKKSLLRHPILGARPRANAKG